MNMVRKVRLVVGSGVAVALLGGGCFPQSIELEHDVGGAAGVGASEGAGTAGTAAMAAAGNASAGNGSSAGSAAGGSPSSAGAPAGGSPATSQTGDSCQVTCAGDYWCFGPQASGSGVCAPKCADDEQESWGKACENSVRGEPGVCRPFFLNGDGFVTPVGMCTTGCDPILQDCPARFACDVTEDRADAMPDRVFSCLPVVEPEPFLEGDACNGFPTGECAPGLSCVGPGDSSAFAFCRVLCDTEAGEPCAASQQCEIPEYFPPGTTIGVCFDD